MDPCKDCFINTVCGERCDARRDYTQDVYAELKGREILYRKNMITREEYEKAENLFNKVQKDNFKIALRRGGTEGDESSWSSTSTSSSSSTHPRSTVRRKKK